MDGECTGESKLILSFVASILFTVFMTLLKLLPIICFYSKYESLKDIDQDQTAFTDETLSRFLRGLSTSLVKVIESSIVREPAKKRVGLVWSSV